jgi:DNA-binding MarR family transcriptional regulator
VAGFWKAPRALVQLLADRKLTPTAYAVLNVVGQAGADRPTGYTTTNRSLAALLAVNEKTIRRVLRSLRAGGFVEYDDHPGSERFTVRTTDALASLSDSAPREPRTRLGHASDMPRTFDGPIASDNPSSSNAGKPASLSENRGDGTSDTLARARAETETETGDVSPSSIGPASTSRARGADGDGLRVDKEEEGL